MENQPLLPNPSHQWKCKVVTISILCFLTLIMTATILYHIKLENSFESMDPDDNVEISNETMTNSFSIMSLTSNPLRGWAPPFLWSPWYESTVYIGTRGHCPKGGAEVKAIGSCMVGCKVCTDDCSHHNQRTCYSLVSGSPLAIHHGRDQATVVRAKCQSLSTPSGCSFNLYI